MNRSLPSSRRISLTGSSEARKSQNSADAAVVAELLLDRLRAAQVADHELEAGHDERRLAGPGDQLVVVERRVLGEDLPVRPEPDPGAGDALLHPGALAGQPGLRREVRRGALPGEDAGVAALEGHPLDRRGPLDVDVEPGGQRVDDRRADAVQPAGGDVRAAAELAAGVQLGEDHLDAGQAGLGLLVHRDAAAVVVHLDGAVGVQGHLDAVRGTGQRLVHAVVDDLPHAVHEPAGVGGADVHARSLPDRLEALQDQEVVGVVRVVDGGSSGAAGWHVTPRRRHLLGAAPGSWSTAPNLLATRPPAVSPRLPSLAGRSGRPWKRRRTSRSDNELFQVLWNGNQTGASHGRLGTERQCGRQCGRGHPVSRVDTDPHREASGVVGC